MKNKLKNRKYKMNYRKYKMNYRKYKIQNKLNNRKYKMNYRRLKTNRKKQMISWIKKERQFLNQEIIMFTEKHSTSYMSIINRIYIIIYVIIKENHNNIKIFKNIH